MWQISLHPPLVNSEAMESTDVDWLVTKAWGLSTDTQCNKLLGQSVRGQLPVVRPRFPGWILLELRAPDNV